MGNEDTRWQAVDDALQALEKDMRDILGDEGVEFSKRLAMQLSLGVAGSGDTGGASSTFCCRSLDSFAFLTTPEGGICNCACSAITESFAKT